MKLVELMIAENIATHQDVQALVRQFNDPRLKVATKDGFPTNVKKLRVGYENRICLLYTSPSPRD